MQFLTPDLTQQTFINVCPVIIAPNNIHLIRVMASGEN